MVLRNDLILMKNKIKIGVIPAAGSGKRLGYLSNLLPKTLFPIYNRPIFHHLIDTMESIEIEDIYVIVNIHKEYIKKYYKSIKSDLRTRIHFIVQKELNGLANAILLTEKYIKNQPFMVILGDECIITDSLKPMIDSFFKTGSIVTEMAIREEDSEILRQTCSLNIREDNKILEILEKPEEPPYTIRGCGIYIFRPEIFEFIRSTPIHPIRKEKDITTVINNVAKTGKAYGYFFNGCNININNSDELLKASILFKESLNKK
jgi:UDP-N-acetylglucosamine diphosphorylase / glucose-1-phosphate thymidylyltransferase / UDP-N-acetylgalactosamine diphosphorylase / glucosamine-1-phosphate N-acetyltransferase / galactosamine-1-phosphate N-acetyltransferase